MFYVLVRSPARRLSPSDDSMLMVMFQPMKWPVRGRDWPSCHHRPGKLACETELRQGWMDSRPSTKVDRALGILIPATRSCCADCAQNRAEANRSAQFVSVWLGWGRD